MAFPSQQAEEVLQSRKQYYLEQSVAMADYIRNDGGAAIEAAKKAARDERLALAEERKQQTRINSEEQIKIAERQKAIKAEKSAKVKAGRANCRDKANRLAEEKKMQGQATREWSNEGEQMLMARYQYESELNKQRHDEVVHSQGDTRGLIEHMAQERKDESQRMKEAQAAKATKLAEEKEALRIKRCQKTLERKQTVRDRTRKSVEDLKESKRAMANEAREEGQKAVDAALTQQRAMAQAIADEEQRLMQELSAVRGQ